MKCHGNTGSSNVGTEAFADPGKLPEGPQQPGLVPVQQRGPQRPDVSARAHQQQQHR